LRTFVLKTAASIFRTRAESIRIVYRIIEKRSEATCVAARAATKPPSYVVE